MPLAKNRGAVTFSLHHVGVLVADLERASASYAGNFGYEIRSEIIDDPVQTASVRFLALPSSDTYLELIAPRGPDSVLRGGLAKGGGVHHLCFATDAMEAALAHLRAAGAVLIRPPAPAVAFRQRPIAWLMDRTETLVEVVEQGTAGELDFPRR